MKENWTEVSMHRDELITRAEALPIWSLIAAQVMPVYELLQGEFHNG